MTSAIILSISVLALFGAVGMAAGIFWRRRAYSLSFPFAILGLICAALGVWLVIDQQQQLAKWGTVTKWPSVQGVVLSSTVVGERAIHPEIVYEYTVGGSLFRDSTTFDTPSFGGRSSKRDVAEAIAAKYSPGTTVTVHYDPSSPSRSLLRVSPDWSLFGKIGLGGTLFGIGMFLASGARRRRR